MAISLQEIMSMLAPLGPAAQTPNVGSTVAQVQQAQDLDRYYRALNEQQIKDLEERKRSSQAQLQFDVEKQSFEEKKEASKRIGELADFLAKLDPTDPKQAVMAQEVTDLLRQSVLTVQGPQLTPDAQRLLGPTVLGGGPQPEPEEPVPAAPSPSQLSMSAVAIPQQQEMGGITPAGQEQLQRMRAPGEFGIGVHEGGRHKSPAGQPLTPQENKKLEEDMLKAVTDPAPVPHMAGLGLPPEGVDMAETQGMASPSADYEFSLEEIDAAEARDAADAAAEQAVQIAQQFTPQAPAEEVAEAARQKTLLADKQKVTLAPEMQATFLRGGVPGAPTDTLVIKEMPGFPERTISFGHLKKKQQDLVALATKHLNEGNLEEASRVVQEVTGDPKFVLKDFILQAWKKQQDKKKKSRSTGSGKPGKGEQSNYKWTHQEADRTMRRHDFTKREASRMMLKKAYAALTSKAKNRGALIIEAIYNIANSREGGKLSDQDFERARGLLSLATQLKNRLETETFEDLSENNLEQLKTLVYQNYKSIDGAIRNVYGIFKRQAEYPEYLPGEKEAYERYMYKHFGGYKWYNGPKPLQKGEQPKGGKARNLLDSIRKRRKGGK